MIYNNGDNSKSHVYDCSNENNPYVKEDNSLTSAEIDEYYSFPQISGDSKATGANGGKFEVIKSKRGTDEDNVLKKLLSKVLIVSENILDLLKI